MEIRGNLVGRREGDQVPDPLRADPAIPQEFLWNRWGPPGGAPADF